MVILAIGLQALDLITFLIAAPMLVQYELGMIGTVYVIGGPLLALAYKAAGTAIVLLLATRAGRYRRFIVAALLVAGAVGLAFNTYALWQVGLL